MILNKKNHFCEELASQKCIQCVFKNQQENVSNNANQIITEDRNGDYTERMMKHNKKKLIKIQSIYQDVMRITISQKSID